MTRGLETSGNHEAEISKHHTIESDFRVPEGVSVPPGLEKAYEALPDAARDQELKVGIETSLLELQARIQARKEQVSLRLEQLIYG